MRASGILLPVSALPSKYGIGSFSKEAYTFVNQLKRGGQKYWQILPLGPTGYGDSPYPVSYTHLDVYKRQGNVNTSETIELLNNSKNRTQGNKTFRQVITVPASVYNSNDVKVQAFAQDFSGNQGESEITELKIDVTNPTISVSWDLNNPSNGRYYKDIRTATVTVTDRNFDEDNVRFNITNTDGTEANISGWSSSSNIGVSDHATSTCQVSFPADGDYTLSLIHI